MSPEFQGEGGVLIGAIVGLCLYIIMLYITGGVFIWWALRQKRACERAISIERVFFFFTFVFLVIRTFWIVLRIWNTEAIAEFILNKLAFISFFTSFTAILFAWIEQLHSTEIGGVIDSKTFLPRV